MATAYEGCRALITGITGQDGSYLAELLLSKGYTVHGIVRRSSSYNTERLAGIYQDPHVVDQRLKLHYGDVTDSTGLRKILEKSEPDEIYHLAAQSHVRVSFDQPEYTADVGATGTLRLLDAVRDSRYRTGKNPHVYLAGSSEMFGSSPPPQTESTPFHPRSPYAVAKCAAYWYGVNYRESYDMRISNGILFNHESPRRGETFVTRKITRAVGRIKLGLQKELFLGNLEAKRDWGFAGDYVRAMWLMCQRAHGGDFVVATGSSISVQDWCVMCFAMEGLDYRDHVRHDPRYLRPAEVDHLQGDASLARSVLGWQPSRAVYDLARMMLDADMKLARQERALADAGLA